MRKIMIFVFVIVSIAVLFVDSTEIEKARQESRPVKQMAVTIDDLVVAQPSWHTDEQMKTITDDLLTTLRAHGVKTVGFVNEGKLIVEGRIDDFRVSLLQRWLEEGHELGNHGYAHLDLHRVSTQEWKEDVIRGETATRHLIEMAGSSLRWFRHPYLHLGMSREIQEEMAGFLAGRGYIVAPVTIDNSEWVYGRAYARAYNDSDEELMRRIGEDYLRYMLDVVSFYEKQSQTILDRPIPHVLLIHAYALNADWLGELLEVLESRGYQWMTLEQALKDPAYDLPTDGWTGRGGITWLHRWAITKGVDHSKFRGEPEVPEWVEQIQLE